MCTGRAGAGGLRGCGAAAQPKIEQVNFLGQEEKFNKMSIKSENNDTGNKYTTRWDSMLKYSANRHFPNVPLFLASLNSDIFGCHHGIDSFFL